MNKLPLVLLFVLAGAPALAQVQIPPPPQSPAPGPAPRGAPPLQPGLYVQVVEGAIQVTNSGGAQTFAAGQFGYIPSVTQPPVIVPSNPGIQFTPPPVFNTGGSGPTSSTGGNAGAVDCIVR